MTVSLAGAGRAAWPAPADPAARPPAPEDRVALAQLLRDAYRGTVDDEGETHEEALATVEHLFAGEFGRLLRPVSEVVERGGALVHATLVTRWHGSPVVAFNVTHPDWRRLGLARAALQRAMARLAAGDDPLLSLVVTDGNPAEALFRSLGFVREPARTPDE